MHCYTHSVRLSPIVTRHSCVASTIQYGVTRIPALYANTYKQGMLIAWGRISLLTTKIYNHIARLRGDISVTLGQVTPSRTRKTEQ